ncbi:MAG: HDIG domain-containing protein [Candidatus Parcubacteria bacterium]|nr:MAG: HDIG domain-containing protein [Candidatus Parcubacteria bacterium]
MSKILRVNKNKIPSIVLSILKKIIDNGYEAYLVGGCVRDLLLNKIPKDWDITTNALPQDILRIFPEQAFYENRFGTVGIKTDSEDDSLKVIEVTTFRMEEKYSDFRRPDIVKFVSTLKDDLKRRDFTINALALNNDLELIDHFNGLQDLQSKIIKTVGDPEERFREDALRLIRAIRFSCELDFTIDKQTLEAISKCANFIQYIAYERIRDEFNKIIMSNQAIKGIELLRETNLLIEILPELYQGYKVSQNKHHIYDVYTHNLKSCEYAVQKKWPLHLRLAALFHDIGKPMTKQGEGPECTFYNHEIVGAKITKKLMERFRYDKNLIKKVSHLVRHHMFYLEIDKVTPAAVRRFIRRVGDENLDDLFKLREADRIGSGVPKAVPYRLRYLKFLVEKVKLEPIKPTLLKLKGQDLLNLGIPQGPKIGWILKILLEEVIDNPQNNNFEFLYQRAKELKDLDDTTLKSLAEKGEEKIEAIEEQAEENLKKKYWVK